jgi:ATP-dependent protease ClpP protease subunit
MLQLSDAGPSGPTTQLSAPGDTGFLMQPNVRLYGPIDDAAVKDFLTQINAVRATDEPVVLELTTEGGDAEGGRRIALEIRLFRKFTGRQTFFIGKTVVMSAGATIMAAFPNTHRYVTEDTVLLIHERRMQKSLDLNGPVKGNIQIVREMLAQLETAERIEYDGFAEFAAGSKLSSDEMYKRATENCYLTARQALDLGLIAGVI